MHKITTLTLTAVAGFVDTTSFIHMHGMFAAHVTGNFVIFVAELAHGIPEEDYIKLIAFPVFVLFIICGALIFCLTHGKKFGGLQLLLLLQTILFASVAAASHFIPGHIPLYYLMLILVAGMGLQNSLHRYLPGPSTTMMTGALLNWSASKAEMLFNLPIPEYTKELNENSIKGLMIIAFALGCIVAGLAAPAMGLTETIIPVILLLLLILFESSKSRTS